VLKREKITSASAKELRTLHQLRQIQDADAGELSSAIIAADLPAPDTTPTSRLPCNQASAFKSGFAVFEPKPATYPRRKI